MGYIIDAVYYRLKYTKSWIYISFINQKFYSYLSNIQYNFLTYLLDMLVENTNFSNYQFFLSSLKIIQRYSYYNLFLIGRTNTNSNLFFSYSRNRLIFNNRKSKIFGYVPNLDLLEIFFKFINKKSMNKYKAFSLNFYNKFFLKNKIFYITNGYRFNLNKLEFFIKNINQQMKILKKKLWKKIRLLSALNVYFLNMYKFLIVNNNYLVQTSVLQLNYFLYYFFSKFWSYTIKKKIHKRLKIFKVQKINFIKNNFLKFNYKFYFLNLFKKILSTNSVYLPKNEYLLLWNKFIRFLDNFFIKFSKKKLHFVINLKNNFKFIQKKKIKLKFLKNTNLIKNKTRQKFKNVLNLKKIKSNKLIYKFIKILLKKIMQYFSKLTNIIEKNYLFLIKTSLKKFNKIYIKILRSIRMMILFLISNNKSILTDLVFMKIKKFYIQKFTLFLNLLKSIKNKIKKN